MPINKEKLQAREEARVSRPEFIRPESWRYKRLETNWRKPKGIDNHQRKQKRDSCYNARMCKRAPRKNPESVEATL